MFFGRGGSPLFGIITLVCGIIVLIFPQILNYLVGIYLIVLGIRTLATRAF